MLGRCGYLSNRFVERLLVCRGRLAHAGDLSHVLQRGGGDVL
jgi:hypothetical protein